MPGGGAGVDHAGDRVVPRVLLGGRAWSVGVVGIGVLDHLVARVATADPRRLHPPGCGEVGRPEAHPLHPGARGRDLLQVDHAERGLEDRVDQQRRLQLRLRLELGQQAVDVVDVPGPLDLRDHDHLELVADLGDELGEVVEAPGTLELVHPGPELGVAEVDLPGDLDQALAGRDLPVDRDGVLEVAEQDVGLLDHVRDLGAHLLVGRVEEMDHPRGLEGDLVRRFRRPDRQRLEEVSWVSHEGNAIWTRMAGAPRIASRHGEGSRGGPGRGREGARHVRVAVRTSGVRAAELGPGARAGGDRGRDRGRVGCCAGGRASRRAARPLHGVPRAELGPLRAALLGGGPGGQPGAPLRGSGEGLCSTRPRTGRASVAPPTSSSTAPRAERTPTASTSGRVPAGAPSASPGSS